MENQLNITVENGVKEVVFRQGEAPKIHIPKGFDLQGLSIHAVKEYLSKDGIESDEIKNSYIVFSSQEKTIELVYAGRREKQDNIKGFLKIDPDLDNWGINSGNDFTTHALANFIRLNRHYFESKDTALKLVNELQNFRAKVDKEIEASDDKKANVKMMLVQKVTSNIPTEFVLKLPLFVGTEAVSISVEIDIDAQDLSCSLVSPELKELVKNETEAIINSELAEIKKMYPELRIFQK